MNRDYFVSVHYFVNDRQTSKHKERAFTMTVNAYNNFHAEEYAKQIVKENGRNRRIASSQSFIII